MPWKCGVDALLAEKVPVEKIEGGAGEAEASRLADLAHPGRRRPDWSGSVKTRRELFLRLLPLVEAIDVELATAKAMQSVIDAARRTGKTVVLSAHAIARPATAAQIAKWLGRFDHRPATILKIAARIKSWRDLQQLAAFVGESSRVGRWP